MVLNDIFISTMLGFEPSKDKYDIIKKTINAKGKIRLQVFGMPPDNLYKWIRIIDLENNLKYLWKLESENILSLD